MASRRMRPDPAESGPGYTQDFYGWTLHQSELLRTGRVAEADLVHIAEEIETLGRSERSALESAYRLICLHQLKRMAQPERAGSRSWTVTIGRERLCAARILRDNPALRPLQDQLFQSAYGDARKEAALETKLAVSAFSVKPPFTRDEMMDETFWADGPG